MSMRNKIDAIGKIFNSTFMLYSTIDTTLPQDKYLHITKQDRKMMKMMYKLYDMKKHYGVYSVFEESVISVSLDANTLPVVTAQVMAEKLSEL